MGFFGGEKKVDPKYALVATLPDGVSSAILQEILRDNGIPFLCRQEGLNGILKITTGGAFAPDDIYVMRENLERATELYNAYLCTELEENEISEEN